MIVHLKFKQIKNGRHKNRWGRDSTMKKNKVDPTCLFANTRSILSRSSSSLSLWFMKLDQIQSRMMTSTFIQFIYTTTTTQSDQHKNSFDLLQNSSSIQCPPRTTALIKSKEQNTYIRCSSSRAASTRSLSLESTTKISPCVFW